MDPLSMLRGGSLSQADFSAAQSLMSSGGSGAASTVAKTGMAGAASLGSTLATAGITAGLTAAPMILEGLIKNDQVNRERAALRKQQRQAHKFKVDQLKAAYQTSWNQTDSYNQGLVAAHNAKVAQYDANIALLQTEEAFAFEAAQLNAGAEVASFMEDNLDLLKGFVQGGGQLAAAGITSGSAQLAQMKNYVGGYLQARTRRRGAAGAAIGSILRDMDKIEMMGNAKRDAMYAQVKDKPALRTYPTMPNIPSYETPDNLKTKGFGFGDAAPALMAGATAGFLEVGGMDWIKNMTGFGKSA